MKYSDKKLINKPNKGQAFLFSELDFIKRNPESTQPAASEPKLEVIIGIDCIYYIGAGNCVVRGDAFGCEECPDYKSINGDKPDDE
jgi:hypothetical protein